MRKPIADILITVFTCFVLSAFAQAPDKAVEVGFSPAEVESMLFLYNQTPVKGADVEMVAPVGAKLRAALKNARTMKDTTQAVQLAMTAAEIQVCLGVIQASTFEAKYAELVYGMKRKLEALIRPAPADDAKGGKKK
jgi:hypothetical protein